MRSKKRLTESIQPPARGIVLVTAAADQVVKLAQQGCLFIRQVDWRFNSYFGEQVSYPAVAHRCHALAP